MVGDTQAAIDFLKKFYGGSRWVLTAVIPDGTTDTRTFNEEKIAEAFEWLLKFLQFRSLPLAIKILFSKSNADGDISHFSALMTAQPLTASG